MKPLSFIIVGSGWRSMFYAEIARRYPERFHLEYMLCRREEKAAYIRQEYQIPATTSVTACEAARPDFVVVAVSKPSICEVTLEWAEKGFAVLCETPAGMTVEQLKALWESRERFGSRIQVAEQYTRYPILAAGLQAIRQGRLGEPYAVHLSIAHDYHGVSLIRHMLNLKPGPVRLWGRQDCYPVMETDSRYGAITDGSVKERERNRILMEFGSGKTAFYDFSGVQYHSYIRSRHLNVQGQNGEWNDTIVRYVQKAHPTNSPSMNADPMNIVPMRNNGKQFDTPEGRMQPDAFLPTEERLHLYRNPRYKELETDWLKEKSRVWNPVLELEREQDEYAIAAMMFDMKEFMEDGVECYPLAEALEDAYVWILMQKALKNPGIWVESERMPWQDIG
ncbi:MAG: Gfo/Idh/MocA family oxidoreductase [Lachnospiraceae bacterium]|nr:Gfo/Idh/MocA family oxidoreductase [Lachnospiraceae bacterium]